MILFKRDDCPKVGDRALNVFLASFPPNLQPDFVIDIVKKFNFTRHCNIYKVLGSYDFLILGISEDFRLFEKTFEFSTLTNPAHIRGFLWNTTKNLEKEEILNKKIEHILDKHVVGICLIKLNTEKIEDETDIINEINKVINKNSRDGLIFCGMGTHEIVCVVGCDNYHQLHKLTLDLRKEHWKERVIDTSTISGINYGSIFPDYKNSEKPIFDYTKVNEKLKESIKNATVFITCEPSKERKVIEYIKSMKDVPILHMFGWRDIEVRLEEVSLSDLLRLLFTLRLKAEELGIISTETYISYPETDGLDIYSPREPMNKILISSNYEPSKTEELKTEGIHKRKIEEDINHFLHLFAGAINDPMKRRLFDTVGFSFKRFRNRIGEMEASEDAPDVKEYINHRVTTFRRYLQFLFPQRLVSYQWPYLLKGGGSGYERFSGVQRACIAVDGYVSYFKKYLAGYLPSAVLFGNTHQPLEYCGLVSLPLEYIHEPERIWTTHHEIGHSHFGDWKAEYPGIKNISETFSKFYRDHLDKTAVTDILKKEKELEHAKLQKFHLEIYGDLIDFYFGFYGDFDTYFNAVWSFYREGGYDLTWSRCARTCLIYSTHKRTLNNKTWEDICKDIEEVTGRKIPPGEKNDISENIDEGEKYIRAMKRRISFKLMKELVEKQGKTLQELENKDIDDLLEEVGIKPKKDDIGDIKNHLADGNVLSLVHKVKEIKKDPTAIIYTMQKEGMKDFKSRMTALIAIYYLTNNI